jgi:hypothetical protein
MIKVFKRFPFIIRKGKSINSEKYKFVNMEQDETHYNPNSSSSEEEKGYEKDAENIIKDLTGYEYDLRTRTLKEIKGVKPIFCMKIAKKLIDILNKPFSKQTKYTKNNRNTVTFKSVSALKDLIMVWSGNFSHDCSFTTNCIREKNRTEWNNIIQPIWRIIDDCYNHSLDGFTRMEKSKTTIVNEQRTISLRQEQEKQGWMDKFMGKKPKMKSEEE